MSESRETDREVVREESEEGKPAAAGEGSGNERTVVDGPNETANDAGVLEEKAKDDDDEVTTITDFFLEEDRAEQEARALLGGQDDSVCTYPEGYKPRQALYSCLTCTPNGNAGTCYGCAMHCHDGHDLVELFTKRRFKCDCGNAAFEKKCTLFEDKPAKNERNLYNHNFVNKYCECTRPFPDPDGLCDEEMIQCVSCEDWFHPSHIGLPALTEIELANCELVCKACCVKLPFLIKCKNGSPSEETVSCTVMPEAVEGGEAKAFLLAADWRAMLCKCAKCEDLYDREGCDWIHDDDDSIEKYNKDAVEKTANELPPSDEEMVRDLVRTTGPEVAINVLTEVNNLKRKLHEFIKVKSEGGNVLTKDDVTGFFSDLKRARLEKIEREREEGGRTEE